MLKCIRAEPSLHPRTPETFERRNGARRVVSDNEEMDPELSELDDLLGRIDAVRSRLLSHIHFSSKEAPFTLQILCQIVGRPRAFFVPPRTQAHLLAATSWPVPAH